MADQRRAGPEGILVLLACGIGMGFIGGIALGGISQDWSSRDVLLGPAVGAVLALLVYLLHDYQIAQICILAFLGGLAGKLPMQNARENLLKVNLLLLERKIHDEIVQFKEVPEERQRAYLGGIIEDYEKLMKDAATLRDKQAAEGLGERLGKASEFLAGSVERNPEVALRGWGKLRKSAAEAGNRGVWLAATKSLEEASRKVQDAGIRNRARNILNDTASPLDKEPR